PRRRRRRAGCIDRIHCSRGFAVMPRRLLVMVRCSLVVLGSAEKFAHEVLPFWQFWARVGPASLSGLSGDEPVPADVQDKVRNDSACGPASASQMRGAEYSRPPSLGSSELGRTIDMGTHGALYYSDIATVAPMWLANFLLPSEIAAPSDGALRHDLC